MKPANYLRKERKESTSLPLREGIGMMMMMESENYPEERRRTEQVIDDALLLVSL